MTTATQKLLGAFSRLNEVEKKEFLDNVAAIDQTIVTYTVDGKPLTIKEYIAAIEEARQEVKEGKVISREQLLAEIQSW